MPENQELIRFELNNWTPGEDYPDKEPFLTWIGNDLNIYFHNEEWVKENKLCVIAEIIDQSVNFSITAKKEWVEKNCPSLLAEDREFVVEPDENGDYYGKFDTLFLDYESENIGVTWKCDDLDEEPEE